MFHHHPLLGEVVHVQLEDVHTEPGVFIDIEHGFTTTLVVSRCRLCGLVYMPLTPIVPHDDMASPVSIATVTPQLPVWRAEQ